MTRKSEKNDNELAGKIEGHILDLQTQYPLLDITQPDLARWITILTGSDINQSEISKAKNPNVYLSPEKRRVILEGLKHLKNGLAEYGGQDKKQFEIFLTHWKNPSLRRKKYVLYGAVLLLCTGAYWLREYCTRNSPASYRLVHAVGCRVYVRGNDTIGQDKIPWLGVKDSWGSPLWLNEGDSLAITVKEIDKIRYSGKDGYVCTAIGDLSRIDDPKEIHRRPHKIASAPVGSLVYYIRTDGRWKFDTSFFSRRQIPINAPKMVAGRVDPGAGLIKNSGFLFLAVNDHYLYHHTMDSLKSVQDSLMRPWKDALKIYSDHNCDWFYEDNPESDFFPVQIRVYRKKTGHLKPSKGK